MIGKFILNGKLGKQKYVIFALGDWDIDFVLYCFCFLLNLFLYGSLVKYIPLYGISLLSEIQVCFDVKMFRA
jgi:hypothetical protein